jgi:hypothetical protein
MAAFAKAGGGNELKRLSAFGGEADVHGHVRLSAPVANDPEPTWVGSKFCIAAVSQQHRGVLRSFEVGSPLCPRIDSEQFRPAPRTR